VIESLTAAQARLLELETRHGVHLHAGCALLFDGPAPSLERLTELVRSRLDRAPRYRRKVLASAGALGRPCWIDDPHFDLGFHVRAVALPAPAGETELWRLLASVLSHRLDRGKPLWELWLVGPICGERFALIGKSHATLIDGESNHDLLSVLVDERPAAPESPPASRWNAPPPPSGAQLLLATLAGQARDPLAPLRSLGGGLTRATLGLPGGASAAAGAPRSAVLHAGGGLQRRYASIEVGIGRLRRERERLGGTINDAVLTAVAGALGRYLGSHGEDTRARTLRALVPLADAGSPRLLAAHVPLPVGIDDPRRRHAEISRALDGLAASGRARGARDLVGLAGFAPPTLLGQAAALAAGERRFDLVVTNVPGPSGERYLLGRPLRAIHAAAPLAPGQALAVSVASLRGRLRFGLLADDALGDLDALAGMLEESLAELRKGAGGRRARAGH